MWFCLVVLCFFCRVGLMIDLLVGWLVVWLVVLIGWFWSVALVDLVILIGLFD